METYVVSAVEWIESLPTFQVYAVFLFIAYIENLVPPIPGDVLVAFGGYLAAEDVIGLGPLLAITTVASAAGFMSAYGVGYRWGGRFPEADRFKWPGRVIDRRVMQRATRWMRRWGLWVVVANRFLAGTRSVIALSAGLSATRPLPTLLAATVSSLVWNSILLGFGWVVKANWAQAGAILNAYGKIVLGALALYLFYRVMRALLSGKSPVDAGDEGA